VGRTTFTFVCGAVALAFGAAADEPGKLIRIGPGGDNLTSGIAITGDRPLSFTTLKLDSPPRVVVDFAETDVATEQTELRIEDGTVRRAAIARAGTRTARVVIELVADSEFDVRADGNTVEVRVPRPAALAAVQQPAPEAEAEKVASLPKVSLVGSPATEPPANGDSAPEPAKEPKPEAAKSPQQKPRVTASTSPDLAAASRHITGIGFRPVQRGEVIVRSDHPLEYGVSADGDVVLLHLPSAAIPLPNNRRPLDTRFFDGPVSRVVPLHVPGGTDVRIELREKAEYQLAQTGSVLTVTFSAPQ